MGWLKHCARNATSRNALIRMARQLGGFALFHNFGHLFCPDWNYESSERGLSLLGFEVWKPSFLVFPTWLGLSVLKASKPSGQAILKLKLVVNGLIVCSFKEMC